MVDLSVRSVDVEDRCSDSREQDRQSRDEFCARISASIAITDLRSFVGECGVVTRRCANSNLECVKAGPRSARWYSEVVSDNSARDWVSVNSRAPSRTATQDVFRLVRFLDWCLGLATVRFARLRFALTVPLVGVDAGDSSERPAARSFRMPSATVFARSSAEAVTFSRSSTSLRALASISSSSATVFTMVGSAAISPSQNVGIRGSGFGARDSGFKRTRLAAGGFACRHLQTIFDTPFDG